MSDLVKLNKNDIIYADYNIKGHYFQGGRKERVEGFLRHSSDGKIIGHMYDIDGSTAAIRRSIFGLFTGGRLSYWKIHPVEFMQKAVLYSFPNLNGKTSLKGEFYGKWGFVPDEIYIQMIMQTPGIEESVSFDEKKGLEFLEGIKISQIEPWLPKEVLESMDIQNNIETGRLILTPHIL